jgi:hypothetical protein
MFIFLPIQWCFSSVCVGLGYMAPPLGLLLKGSSSHLSSCCCLVIGNVVVEIQLALVFCSGFQPVNGVLR